MLSNVFNALNTGFLTSVKIFCLTLLGSLPLGLMICFIASSKVKFLSIPAKALIWVVRGTPLMLQLMVFFYFPGMILGVNIWGTGLQGRLTAVTIAFIFNYACYFAEIYRSGIQAVDIGQFEAAKALGLSESQTFFNVILSQVIRIIIPPCGNEIITLVKDTCLSMVIGVPELIYSGERFIKLEGIIWPLFSTALYYLLFSLLVTVLLDRLEKWYARYDA